MAKEQLPQALENVCLVAGRPDVCGVARAVRGLGRLDDNTADVIHRPARRTQESVAPLGLKVAEALAVDRLVRQVQQVPAWERGLVAPGQVPTWAYRLALAGVTGGLAVAGPRVGRALGRHLGRGGFHVNSSAQLEALLTSGYARKLLSNGGWTGGEQPGG